MSRASSHLIIRNGVYTYRRRVPSWLRDRPEFGGRDVFQKSLGVRTVAEARKRIQALRLDDLFEVASSSNDNEVGGVPLSEGLLAQLASNHYRQGIAGLRRHRDLPGEADADELAAQNLGLINVEQTEKRGREVLRWSLSPILSATAQGLAERVGIDPTEANLRRMEDVLFEAELEVEGARVDFASGRAFPSRRPDSWLIREGEEQATAPEAHWTYKRLSEAALRQHRSSEDWSVKVRAAAALFEDFVGPGLPVGKITRRVVQDFVNALYHAPKSMTLRFPGMSMREAIAANEAREQPFSTISPNTVRDGYYSTLRWVFNYALELDALAANPTASVKVKRVPRKKKPPLSIDELNALFRLPFFTGCLSEDRPNHPGNHLFNDHRRWAPLLMLYTGARTSEIAQLAVSDVKDEHRFPHLSILTEFDPEDPDDHDFVVSEKTTNARREVPLHPALIRLGFRDYVEARRTAGDVRLFPGWALPKDRRKRYSSAPWVKNVNTKCIPAISKRVPRPTLYSMRHTWKTQMAKAGVSLQFQNQLLGHAAVGMDDHYLGDLGLESSYPLVTAVEYPGLDIDHLGMPNP